MIVLNATWLETFTTLCDVGHFTRAAQQLGMTQPGVSQHLRKLEAQVGKPLITQDGKAFSVTPAGEAVLKVGRDRRAQERALQDVVTLDDPKTGVVNVGCSGSFAMWMYPLMLEQLREAPELVVNVTAAPQASIVNAVLEGGLDLGVVARNPDHPRLKATHMAHEELCLVVPAGHQTENLNLGALEALGMVGHPDGFAYADELFSANFPDDFKGSDRLKVRTSVNQIGQIPVPVAQGLGYTILPRSGVEAFPDKAKLMVVSLMQQRFQDLWLITRQGRAKFARISAIAKVIQQAADDLGRGDPSGRTASADVRR
ncbi:DNA-binding transcriptional regulator, LysR family [Shimia haliotis]|uniref:DNA-binding transcriptional regulator, LysR family n=1 Tax=Shimia haliotis TaxID=1280847 RepID=A0A1I4CQ32_9RHOB|nr:DNA-binding transcriptional regulator, LysR family [Shimia haliotis]